MLNTSTVLSSSALIAFAFSLGLTAHAAEAIKVGVVTPLSGSYAPIGKQVRWGAELAVKEINAGGGVGGRSFELLFEDERSEEHTSELQSLRHLVCRLLLEKKKKINHKKKKTKEKNNATQNNYQAQNQDNTSITDTKQQANSHSKLTSTARHTHEQRNCHHS